MKCAFVKVDLKMALALNIQTTVSSLKYIVVHLTGHTADLYSGSKISCGALCLQISESLW